jgi:hypothetical protein
MAAGLKKNETRSRYCTYRGDVAIHAGKYDTPTELWAGLPESIHDIPDALRVHGAILCVVELFACTSTGGIYLEVDPLSDEAKLGNYGPGRYILRTRNLRVLRNPVPCRGFQAVPWEVPPDIEALVKEQLP